MNTRLITLAAMLTVAIMSAIMCVAACFILKPDPAASTDFGLVLPSPNLWDISPLWSEIINVAIIGLSAPAVFLINKHFSLLKSSLPFWALFYLPLICCNIFVSGRFTAGILLLPTVLAILVALFNSYRSRNATRSIFFIATCISIGSTVQQAFLPLLPASIIGTLIMKALHGKEIMALLLGLVAPYWVLTGFGIITPSDFSMPVLSPLFTSGISPEMVATATGTGVLFAIGLFLSLYNGIKLYAGNSRIRGCNNVVNVFGITATAAMIFDTANLTAYLGIFALWTGLQFANLFTLWNLPRPTWVFWIIQGCILAYAAILSLTLIF